jgi:hypothetical protein
MSTDLLQAVREEEQRLVDELRQNPTFRKLEAVRLMIGAYEAGAVTGFGHATIQAPRAMGRISAREGTKAFNQISEAQAFLRKKGRRAQTREIMEALEEQGIVIASEKPLAALASTLSHSALFNNVRGEGYGLVEWENADTQPYVATPPDHSVNKLSSIMQPVAQDQSEPDVPNLLQSITR